MPKWTGYVIVGALAFLALAVWRLGDSVYALRFSAVAQSRTHAFVLDGANGTIRKLPLDTNALLNALPAPVTAADSLRQFR